MKDKKLKTIYNLLNKFLSLFFTIFGIYILAYSLITSLIFKFYNLPLNYLAYIFIIAIVVTIILTIFLSLDNISIYFQAGVVYLIIAASVFLIGFLTKCFSFNKSFWIATIIINLCGIILILLVISLKSNLENKQLNKKLQEYKEKNKNEK